MQSRMRRHWNTVWHLNSVESPTRFWPRIISSHWSDLALTLKNFRTDQWNGPPGPAGQLNAVYIDKVEASHNSVRLISWSENQFLCTARSWKSAAGRYERWKVKEIWDHSEIESSPITVVDSSIQNLIADVRKMAMPWITKKMNWVCAVSPSHWKAFTENPRMPSAICTERPDGWRTDGTVYPSNPGYQTTDSEWTEINLKWERTVFDFSHFYLYLKSKYFTALL